LRQVFNNIDDALHSLIEYNGRRDARNKMRIQSLIDLSTHPIAWFFDLGLFVTFDLSQMVASIIFLFQSKSKGESDEQ
jgi:hypothetical protein